MRLSQKTAKMIKKNKNETKIDSEKMQKNDILNVKFANIMNIKLFKYTSLFINKTFNNLL
jgi:hypothetical protein